MSASIPSSGASGDAGLSATPASRRRPEVLAPAGDEAALRAALAAGADAVYFGLSEGFNARARAGNFTRASLPATVAQIHRAGARAYLTLNTLVFEDELADVELAVRAAAESGVDALIVQDVGLAALARAVCPELALHASTQMTISSPQGARFAASLGITRVVVPRELSVEEIRRFAAGTPLEVEVFVHGALCVSWSGQCLTSSLWSARSANRGECAQSCRLPYDLVVDGHVRDLGDVKYLLSPKDLAGLRAVDELTLIGVHGLKIEGRQKGAAYVLTATGAYRRWVDALLRGPDPQDVERARTDLADAGLAYTRGFSDGFLGGSDHQTLVEGRFPKHRGLLLGRVARRVGDAVFVEPLAAGRPWTGALAADAPRQGPQGRPASALRGLGGAADASSGPAPAPLIPRAGMGVVFDAGRPEDAHEPGGPIFHVDPWSAGWRLRFGQPGPDLARVEPGHLVWVSSDPALARAAERVQSSPEPAGRVSLALRVSGRHGEALCVEATAGSATCRMLSASPLALAEGDGLSDPLLREKLGSLGGTPFTLSTLDASGLAPGLHLPVSELKALRRRLADTLRQRLEQGSARTLATGSALERVRQSARPPTTPRNAANRDAPTSTPPPPPVHPLLLPLCREMGQLEAVLASGLPEVELDWMEFVGLGEAVKTARAAGLRVTLATLRVQKPGEEGYDRRLEALDPDALLVRHWGALVHFQECRGSDAHARPRLHGDFSLNVTNSLAAAELFARGLDTLTVSHDLNAAQALALLDASDASRFTVALHHRMATFHTEHCVYAHLLSEGRDFRTCGRPCERHRVSLSDPQGREHPVIVDVGCRNTVFSDRPQSAAGHLAAFLGRGVRRFRVEFVRETRAEASAILSAHADLLAGRLSPDDVARRAGAVPRVGVVTTQG